MVSDIPCREYWGSDVFVYLSSFCCWEESKNEISPIRESCEGGKGEGLKKVTSSLISGLHVSFFVGLFIWIVPFVRDS